MCGPRITNLWYDMCGFHTKPFHWFFYVGFWSLKEVWNPFWNHQSSRRFRSKGPMWPPAKKGLKYGKAKDYAYAPRRIRGWVCIYIYKFASLEGSERAPFWTCSFWGSEAGLKPSRSPIWAFNPDWRERGPLGWTLPNIWVCGKKMETMYPRWQYGNKRSRPLQATKFIPPIWMIRC